MRNRRASALRRRSSSRCGCVLAASRGPGRRRWTRRCAGLASSSDARSGADRLVGPAARSARRRGRRSGDLCGQGRVDSSAGQRLEESASRSRRRRRWPRRGASGRSSWPAVRARRRSAWAAVGEGGMSARASSAARRTWASRSSSESAAGSRRGPLRRAGARLAALRRTPADGCAQGGATAVAFAVGSASV